MASKSSKKDIQVTSEGTALFISVNEPNMKFKEEGEYNCRFCIPKEEAEELIKYLDNKHEESYEKAVNEAETPKDKKKVKKFDAPYQPELDDEGVETGSIVINFKTKASGTRKDGTEWSKTVPVFDSKRKPIDLSTTRVMGGSRVKIAFSTYIWYTQMLGAGVSCNLEAVQILKLSKTNKDASSFGFGEEEGFESKGDADEDDAIETTEEGDF